MTPRAEPAVPGTNVCDAVILAAGRGRRLGQLAGRRHKSLLTVCGEPLLAHVARSLCDRTSIRKVIVITHHLANQVEVAATAMSPVIGVDVSVARDPFRGRPGFTTGVMSAWEMLGPTFVVSHANILFSSDLVPALIERHSSVPGTLATIAVGRCVAEARTHSIILRAEKDVVAEVRTRMECEVAGHRPRDPVVSLGVGVFERDLWRYAPPRADYADLLQAAVNEGGRVAMYDYTGPYRHVATTFCLARARRGWRATDTGSPRSGGDELDALLEADLRVPSREP